MRDVEEPVNRTGVCRRLLESKPSLRGGSEGNLTQNAAQSHCLPSQQVNSFDYWPLSPLQLI